MLTPGRTRAPWKGTALLSARLKPQATLEAQPSGEIVVRFHDYALRFGKFSAATAERAQELVAGLPFGSFVADDRSIDDELHRLVQRLANQGLIDYRLKASHRGEDLVIVEPQGPEYWPRMPRLRDTDALVLSRFAYLRRRGNELVVESPRSKALFKICNSKIASALAILATPHQIKHLRRQHCLLRPELLALLLDCQVMLRTKSTRDDGLGLAEGDDNLVLWDFHDLLFHTRSTEGRHANPVGGVYLHSQTISPPPAARPPWLGKKIPLSKLSTAEALSPLTSLLRQRHSERDFDAQRPITLDELSRFLEGTAAILSENTSRFAVGGDHALVPSTTRSYPSAGGCYELELYLAVEKCEGLKRGFYHYDAREHALAPIAVSENDLNELLMRSAFAMGAALPPQVLITIAARFSRVSWKYSSIAYALILKDVGVLMQNFYLMATDMEIGGCAIGITNIELFAKMTGIEFHVEGAVGQFAIGRGTKRRPRSA